MEQGIVERIEHNYPQLGRQSRRVAEYILDKKDSIADVSVKTISVQSGVSVATVSRLAQQLGFNSFSELKWSLVNELMKNDESFGNINDDDTPKVVARKTLRANIETLNATFKLLDSRKLTAAVELMVHARNISFFGLGGSNIVALDAYYKFIRTPLDVHHDTEYHMALIQASRMTQSDCAMVISHSGNDTDTIKIVNELQINGVPTIIVTSYPNSTLAQLGTIVFISISEDKLYQHETLVSLTSQMAVNSCLYSLVVQHMGEPAQATLSRVRRTIAKKHQ